ncbi:TetR family transcriptional regulator [Sphingomonas sp. BLCC-B65]|nr:TetR family transcriptional regulator [Sphingomonas sp. BLCC-B65]
MDTKTRLVEAAQELLWERGYAATSPKDILRRADAGQGSMYHHFDGKQELALDVQLLLPDTEADDLDDGLHSNTTAYKRMGARFAEHDPRTSRDR